MCFVQCLCLIFWPWMRRAGGAGSCGLGPIPCPAPPPPSPLMSRPILLSLESFLYFALVLPPSPTPHHPPQPPSPLYDSYTHGFKMLGCVCVCVCAQEECARLGEGDVHCWAPLGPASAAPGPGVAVCEDEEAVRCPAWPLPGGRRGPSGRPAPALFLTVIAGVCLHGPLPAPPPLPGLPQQLDVPLPAFLPSSFNNDHHHKKRNKKIPTSQSKAGMHLDSFFF